MEAQEDIPSLSAGLLSLPDEVFYRSIFPKLEYRDLLRLRRVCKPIKIYGDDYIRNNFISQVREINESNYTLEHFLQANLPTASIFINNSSPTFFEDPHITQFLQLYGDQITHVRIRHFVAFTSLSELHFFSSLPNLLHLDLDFIDATKRDCMTTDNAVKGIKVPREKSPFPDNFKNLKTLKLHEIQGSQKNDLGYAWDFIEFCGKLEYVKHPLYKEKRKDDPGHPKGPFGCVMDYIKKLHLTNPGQPNLQFYDLEHQTEGRDFFGIKRSNLLGLCDYLKVKLLNVNGNLFVKEYARLGYQVPLFPMPLVSLRNIHAFAFMAELPNLEKLVVESVEDSSYAETFRWSRTDGVNMAPVEVPKWTNLEILDLMIDCREMSGDDFMPESLTTWFLRFLFGPGRKREKLRELSLRFCEYLIHTLDDESQMPIQKVKDITNSCPFVTKLTLQNWSGTNRAVAMFWKGLPLLEEVVLDKCEDLADVAFVGKEREDPVFLKLKHLRKVSLKGLDIMSDITDLAFNLVFRHLKIKEFYLSCEDEDYPVLTSVTATGIEGLLDGDFNSYVEKFPFDGWSLDEVSEEEFEQLKLKFRASYMI